MGFEVLGNLHFLIAELKQVAKELEEGTGKVLTDGALVAEVDLSALMLAEALDECPG